MWHLIQIPLIPLIVFTQPKLDARVSTRPRVLTFVSNVVIVGILQMSVETLYLLKDHNYQHRRHYIWNVFLTIFSIMNIVFVVYL